MERRAFMVLTAGAAAVAFTPWGIAEELEQKNPVAYPDPAVEAVDARFAKYIVDRKSVV